MDRPARNWRTLLLSTLLAAGTFAVFLPVLNAGFIRLDDGVYVVHNPHVATGLNEPNINWAFRSWYQANWHPLTWLSHMLDVELFGLNAGRHHLINVLLHSANSVLLFMLLQRLTQAPWRSALVAGLFALHPLHVESVAWIAERKDVLSAFFFVLTLLSYCRYADLRPKTASKNVGDTADRNACATGATANTPARSPYVLRFTFYASRITHYASRIPPYALTLFLFALGLMCKPMLVTLPVLLLLLDFWPLRRFEGDSRARLKELVREKLPFLALSFVSCVITMLAASEGRAGTLHLPLTTRLANMVASYLKYLGHTFWPTDLAIFYPHPATRYPFSTQWPAWELLAGALVLIGISVLAVRWRKGAPWFTTGWFWHLISLLPVIGLIQVGGQAMADRYTYIPLVGLLICVVWGLAEGATKLQRFGTAEYAETGKGEYFRVFRVFRGSVFFLAAIGLAVLLACALVTRHQLSFWRTNSALFEHTLAVTCDNAVAFYNVGRSLEEQGNPNQAMPFFRAALAADPSYFLASSDLGLLLEERGHAQQALALYLQAVRHAPWAGDIQNHLGTMLWKMGRPDEALQHYLAAIRAAPDFADAHYNLATCLASRGQLPDAVSEFETVVRLRPDDAEAHASLAQALLNEGEPAAAEARFRQVVLLAPTNAAAHVHLGMLAASRNDPDAALAEFRLAVKFRPDWPEALNALAFILATHPKAESRDGTEAVRLAERACAMVGTNQPRFWGTLDAAYAEAGRFPEAIRAAEKARDLALGVQQKGMADAASARIELYRKGRAFHQ